jgi:hypothetical protein
MLQAVRALVVAGATALAFVVACGSPLNPAGTACSSDEDCSAGLACLDLASSPGKDCKVLFKVCSKSCKSTGDCAAVGENYECTPTCDGKGTCGRTR